MALDVFIVSMISVLLLVAGHYFDWRGLLGRPLGRLPSYVYGVASIVGPLVVMYALSGRLPEAIALVVVAVASGLAVIGCHLLDDWIKHRQVARDALERESQLRKLLDNEPTQG